MWDAVVTSGPGSAFPHGTPVAWSVQRKSHGSYIYLNTDTSVVVVLSMYVTRSKRAHVHTRAIDEDMEEVIMTANSNTSKNHRWILEPHEPFTYPSSSCSCPESIT